MMEFEPAQLRGMLLYIGISLAIGLCRGLAPSVLRTGARKTDPSIGAALFFTFSAPVFYGLSRYEGLLSGLLAVNTSQWARLGLCGLVAAFTLLCLFTALTGGLVNKVFPVLYGSVVVLLGVDFVLKHQRPSLWGLCAAVLVLLGLVLILSRSTGLMGQLWFVYTLLALAGYCGLTVLRTQLVGEIDQTVYGFGVSLAACVLLWLFVLMRGKQKTMGKMGVKGWIFPPLTALILGAGWLLMDYRVGMPSYSLMDITQVAAFALTLFLARVIHREKLPATAFFGMLLAGAGMVLIQLGI